MGIAAFALRLAAISGILCLATDLDFLAINSLPNRIKIESTIDNIPRANKITNLQPAKIDRKFHTIQPLSCQPKHHPPFLSLSPRL